MLSLNSLIRNPLCRRMLILALVALSGTLTLVAQQSGDQVMVEKETLQRLMQRIDQLEARVKQLETDRQQAAAGSGPRSSPSRAHRLPWREWTDRPPRQAYSAQPAAPSDPNACATALQNAVAQTAWIDGAGRGAELVGQRDDGAHGCQPHTAAHPRVWRYFPAWR